MKAMEAKLCALIAVIDRATNIELQNQRKLGGDPAERTVSGHNQPFWDMRYKLINLCQNKKMAISRPKIKSLYFFQIYRR